MIKVGVVKVGNIGVSTVIDLILDERADRDGFHIRTISTGSKMGQNEVNDIIRRVKKIDVDLLLFISPSPGARQIRHAIDEISKLDLPLIIVGDKPGENAIPFMKERNLGYILVRADAMIGARREFLDSTEMAVFNSYVLNVLSITGVIRLLHEEIDKVLDCVTNDEPIAFPEIIVTAQKAVSYARFSNPYAEAKAIAAYQIASQVSEMDVTACFRVSDPKEYIPLVVAAHEMMKSAAILAEEARELEKSNDTVTRTPHKRDGSVVFKSKLLHNFEDEDTFEKDWFI
ncbi:MAG: methylenetetrahydromethanopterin dehydrogenase [Methanosphaera sp. rholeuAM130]|nr:F420-dependent methylenetetrahydromethanopterin dehydrogenase [Methanosphaera sp.]RAP53926.1 MAG: methylenetetrahydromethanopterin dehydrogenase [Methanosphaera sp. rholeuAM130]